MKYNPSNLKIRYRDSHGHFVPTNKAKRIKKVKSEIYDANSGKKIGRSVQGFFTDKKKLTREAMPTFTPKKQKEYTPRHKPKPIIEHRVADFSDEYDEDPEDETLDEFEELWADDFEMDFGELDVLDDLEEMLADEDEWYEE